jgi:hypothetical protein
MAGLGVAEPPPGQTGWLAGHPIWPFLLFFGFFFFLKKKKKNVMEALWE